MCRTLLILSLVTQRTVGPASDLILEAEVEMDGEISLYNPSTEQVTILNGTASDIWRLADGEHTVDEIIDLLAAAYHVAQDEIARDVQDTVARFFEEGLLGSR